MISTPVPFQRNFTVVPNPMPLGYVNAMVSPVCCEASIPCEPERVGTPWGMCLPR